MEDRRKSPQYNESGYYDDEISLVDLWLVLARRKWFIIGVVFLCTALGSGYAMMTKQQSQYTYRSGIDLARVYRVYIEDGDFAGGKVFDLVSSRTGSIDLLEDVIIPEQRDAMADNPEQQPPRVQVHERGDDHNLMITSTSDPENINQVKKLHRAVVDALSERHAPHLDKSLAIRTRSLEARADMISRHIEILSEQLEMLSNRSDLDNETRSLINSQQSGAVREELIRARLRYVDANNAVKALHDGSHGTRLSFLAVQSEFPEGAGKQLLIGLSIILGIMIGVFGAFFAEFLTKVRAVTMQQKNT